MIARGDHFIPSKSVCKSPIVSTRCYAIGHSVVDSMCKGQCDDILGDRWVPLNRCTFYRELYGSDGPDINADFLYHGVSHGFKSVSLSVGVGVKIPKFLEC